MLSSGHEHSSICSLSFNVTTVLRKKMHSHSVLLSKSRPSKERVSDAQQSLSSFMQPMLAYCPVATLSQKDSMSAKRIKVQRFLLAASHLFRRGYRTVCLTT
jgi:hypothetical protein